MLSRSQGTNDRHSRFWNKAKRSTLSASIAMALAASSTVAHSQSVTETDPLSSMVAVSVTETNLAFFGSTTPCNEPDELGCGVAPSTFKSVEQFMKDMAAAVNGAGGNAIAGFPLENSFSDTVRVADGLTTNVVISWLDPLQDREDAFAPRYGTNNDFIAYFGDGWDGDWDADVVGSSPQYNGNPGIGWVWVNHEYMSNAQPGPLQAPTGMHLTLAKFLEEQGIFDFDVTVDANWDQAASDTYIRFFKQQIGGSWVRIGRTADGTWKYEKHPGNKRYDSTDSTLLKVTTYQLEEADNLDSGTVLPDDLVVGILADCSGGQMPWGTVITAEENAQDYYGDLETAWTSSQQFKIGEGFDPGSNISPTFTPSTGGQYGRASNPDESHNRDVYGFFSEMDPGKPSNQSYVEATGEGHRKIGAMGRARWENAAVAVGEDFALVDGKPIVLYGGNDRRSGRVWKWVSAANFEQGMTKAEVRELLSEGTLYVGHFAGLDNRTGYTLLDKSPECTAAVTESDAAIRDNCSLATVDAPGQGQWIEVSVDSTDIAPNAAALGAPSKTVGQALQDVDWNGIGGFPDDNTVLQALFTAAMKIGAMELNRPEDVEWTPVDPIDGEPAIYVAFTKNGRQVALDQDGVLFDPADQPTQSPTRIDKVGSIARLVEADRDNPGASDSFTYSFVWYGTEGTGPFDVADPDNLAIDANGAVWFGTDGNFGVNGTADAQYYLDLDPSLTNNRATAQALSKSYGLAMRFASAPSDAEATGPAFNSDMTAFFFNVQHPGEGLSGPGSDWPHSQP